MMPIPGYDAVKCAWLRIEAAGYVLHGFLLYTMGDHPFPEYLDGSGMMDLDGWTGRECAVFIIHPPSQAWIDYTSGHDHPWWRIFGNAALSTQARLREQLDSIASIPVTFGGERRTLASILAPPLNQFAHRAEVEKVLAKFCCRSTQHPCLILFKSLRQRKFWFIDMRDLVDHEVPVPRLRTLLRDWFDGRDFQRILREARYA